MRGMRPLGEWCSGVVQCQPEQDGQDHLEGVVLVHEHVCSLPIPEVLCVVIFTGVFYLPVFKFCASQC